MDKNTRSSILLCGLTALFSIVITIISLIFTCCLDDDMWFPFLVFGIVTTLILIIGIICIAVIAEGIKSHEPMILVDAPIALPTPVKNKKAGRR